MGPNYRTGAAWRLATFASLVPLHRLARARLCVPVQALSRSGSMGGAPLPYCLRRPLYWFHLSKTSGRGPAAGRCAAKYAGAGRGFLLPLGGTQRLGVSRRLAEQKAWGLEHKEYPHLKSFLEHEQHLVTKHRARKSPAYVSRRMYRTRNEPTGASFKCSERANRISYWGTQKRLN